MSQDNGEERIMRNDNGDPRARRTALRAVGTLATLAVALTLAACGGGGSGGSGSTAGDGTSAGAAAHTLTIGVASDPQTLDPAWGQATRANETIKNIYAQWTKYRVKDSGKGYLVADLAKDPVGEAIQSYSISANGKVVTIKLRPGAKLPDGSPMDADTFVYKVKRALGMKAGSVFDFNILGITKPSQVEKVSDTEIRFHLPQPSPIVGPMLRDQDAGIVDSAVVKQHSSSSDPWGTKWLAKNGAPTGAYVIDSYRPGTELVLKANPNYWGEKPYFDKVVLQVVPDSDQRSQLLKNGILNIAEDLSTDAISRLKGAPGVKVVSVPSISQDELGFVADKAPFNDKRVRQAIAYAIPYQSLAQNVLGGQAEVAKGVWPQNSVWFDKRVPWPYSTNVAKAKQLLAQAGKANGLSFDVEISDADADAQALAIAVQSALRDIGVTMNIKKVPAAQFAQHLTKRSMQAWIQSNLGAYVDDPFYMAYLSWSSQAVINWYRYSNPVVDKATKELSTTLDRGRRQQLASTIQKQLNEDVPMISLGEPNYLLPVRDNIEGVLWEPDGLLTYKTLKPAG